MATIKKGAAAIKYASDVAITQTENRLSARSRGNQSLFMERWKKEYAEKNMKLTTIDTMYRKLERLNEEIGHMRIDKINRRTIQGLIQSLLDGNKNHKPLCEKSVKDYVSFVSSILNYAIKLDMLSNNPCRNANIPKIKKTARNIHIRGIADFYQQVNGKSADTVPVLFHTCNLQRFQMRRNVRTNLE